MAEEKEGQQIEIFQFFFFFSSSALFFCWFQKFRDKQSMNRIIVNSDTGRAEQKTTRRQSCGGADTIGLWCGYEPISGLRWA